MKYKLLCFWSLILILGGCFYPNGLTKTAFRQLPRYLQHKYEGKVKKNAFSVDTFYCIMVNENLGRPFNDSVVGIYDCKNYLIVIDKLNGTELWDTLDFNYRQVLANNNHKDQQMIDSMYAYKRRRKNELGRGFDSIIKYNNIKNLKEMDLVFQYNNPPPRKYKHIVVAIRCRMIGLIYRNFKIPKIFNNLQEGYSGLSGYYRGGFDEDCWKHPPQFGLHTQNMAFYFYADSFSKITEEQMIKLNWEKTQYKEVVIDH